MPGLNASLNLASSLLLVSGYFFIRRRQVLPHKVCMLSATVLSGLFLLGYLLYHYHHGATRFPGTGWVRTVYFCVLIPHTILAAVQVPLIYRTLFLAFAGRFENHKRWARWTLPIWLYVSVTGVIVYWMLYRFKY